jgi:aminoglycoside N3'-acetyltransferase
MRSLDESSLGRARQIQGFDVTVMQALFHTVPHFVGHTHQILMLTRLALGTEYQFEWSPEQSRTGVPL